MNRKSMKVVMGSVLCIALMILALWPISHQPEVQTPNIGLSRLTVDGNLIKDESGRVVFLRGAAIGDLSWRTSWQGDIVHRVNQLSNLTDGKANVIRLTLTPNPKFTLPEDQHYPWSVTLVDPDNNIWETEIHPEVYKEEVDELLAAAYANDIFVIIEFHGGFCSPGNVGRYGGDCLGPHSYPTALALDPTPWIDWHLYWLDQYSQNVTLAGVELWNEPWDAAFGAGDKSLGRQRWVSMATQAVEAISEAHPEVLVVVASAPYSSVMQAWIDEPLPYNVLYSWDTYYKRWADYWKEEYRNGDWEGGYNKTYLKLHKYNIGAAVDAGLPIITNEFGWAEDPNLEPAWDRQMADFLSIINDWQTHWYIWWWWDSENMGLSRNGYSELGTYGQIWSEYLWDGSQPSTPT